MRIKEGDMVDIFFTDRIDAELDVEVMYTPSATGDSWTLKRMDGTILNVMLFAKMVRTQEANNGQ